MFKYTWESFFFFIFYAVGGWGEDKSKGKL